MLGSTVLEIIIILVFIFLIYSLLATIMVEMIASVFRLRARNLKHSICRMLQDSPSSGPWRGFLEHLKRGIITLFDRDAEMRDLAIAFYNRPSIKYLSRNNIDSTPSYIEPEAFAQTLLDLLIRETGVNELESVKTVLAYDELFDSPVKITQDEWMEWQARIENATDKEAALEAFLMEFTAVDPDPEIQFEDRDFSYFLARLRTLKDYDQRYGALKDWMNKHQGKRIKIEPETRLHLSLLLRQSGEDLTRFKALLMSWFNQTMERSKGWYKKKVSLITFFIGIGIALSFNVDTVFIVKDLKENIAAREGLMAQVEMFTRQNTDIQLDSALQDSVRENAVMINDVLSLSEWKNWDESYFWSLLGWLLTAIAISFGAPFWFDLLNRLMHLRTSKPVPVAEGNADSTQINVPSSHPVTRVVPKG